ncbi:hypothetical protein [Roseibium sp.]|uniref:hypothetical protein n=1 Tax=Roseibium sp. TaxID=1936156 RepID=UPI003BAB358F
MDLTERNHRFLEEAIELVQSTGCTRSEAHQLVDYVYDRPTGRPHQEAGGVMVTLAALCIAAGLNMHAAGVDELARNWANSDKIRKKQASKPKHSPLPQHVEEKPQGQSRMPVEVQGTQLLSEGVDHIAWERHHHLDFLGFGPERDDKYTDRQLAKAALCYLTHAAYPDKLRDSLTFVPAEWPWDPIWWKPQSRIDDLIRAGSLIAAEIDRIKRLERRN